MTAPASADHDVAVIGFGPAGGALAVQLGRLGFRAVVVDERRIPHDKLCGEFLSTEAVARLAELGLWASIRARTRPPTIQSVRLAAPGVDLSHPLSEPGIGLSRMALDGALHDAATAAGVEIRPRWRATRCVESGSGGFSIDGIKESGERDSIRARIVVGAYGKGARLGTAADRTRADADRARYIAWKAHHEGEGPQASVELHFFSGGYCGVAPIEAGLYNVCGIATRKAFLRAGGTLTALVGAACAENPALASRLAGLERSAADLAAAHMSFRRRRPVAGRLLLAGDAAAMIAPLCGDGIGMALSSAAIASSWVAAALSGRIGNEEMLAGYAASWRRAFNRPLAIAAGLQRMLLDTRHATIMLNLGRAWPPLVDWLVRSTRDTVLARNLADLAGAG